MSRTHILAPPGVDPVDVTAIEFVDHIGTHVPIGTLEISEDGLWDIAYTVEFMCPVFGLMTSAIYTRMLHETDYFRFTGDVDPNQHNYGGLGATGDGEKGLSFQNPIHGTLAVIFHELTYQDVNALDVAKMTDPRWMAPRQAGYSKRGLTIEDFGNGVWGADPDYAEKMLRIHRRLTNREDDDLPDLFVMIAAGHHNAQGGNAIEKDIVDEITEYVYQAFSRHDGVRVVSLTPDGPDDDDIPGDGDSPYKIYEMWRKGIEQHGVPDLAFEIHTEGVNNASVNGAFVIYPDWENDVDGDVRDELGPNIVGGIVAETEIGQRGNGTMSEKNTGVGLEGHRLGFFAATEQWRNTLTRFIVECGAHTNFDDLEQLKQDGVKRTIAENIVRSCLNFYGVAWEPEGDWNTPTVPAEIIEFSDTGRVASGSIAAYWKNNGGYQTFGPAFSNVFTIPGLDNQQFQIFQRNTVIEYMDREDDDPWKVECALDWDAEQIKMLYILNGVTP